MTEKLHMALLLAGTRAAFERAAIYVEVAAHGITLSSYCPVRGRTALRVAPDGAISDYPSRTPRGHVNDLLSTGVPSK